MVEILTIETGSLGDHSYLAIVGRVAVVVDPQRDTERLRALAAERGAAITHVLETHVHNDYVTGGLQLARATGAAYVLSAEDPVEFERLGVVDGDVLEITTDVQVRVLATPGHTFTHVSYVLEQAGEPVAVFTGGSLLFGSTGRPDLLGPEHAETLARHQHASAHRLLAELPASTAVYPTHGFGSFCTATPTHGSSSTIGLEAERNPALGDDVEAFVESTLAGLDAYPAYYAHLAPLNLAGPDEVDRSAPHPASAPELRRRLDAGEWVVDLRLRTAFSSGHLRGAYYFGTDGKWLSHLGWLIPWGTPLTLLAATEDDVAAAQRELARIGIDRPAAAATGDPQDWAGAEPLVPLVRASFADLRARLEAHDDGRVVVLDVRRRLEWGEAHLSGARSLPLHELLARVDDVPAGQVWTHCRSGFRAMIAASLLQAAGRDVVAVDEAFERAHDAGLEVVRR